MVENITELTDEIFHDFISNNKVVLLDTWAEWCSPCKAIAPTFQKLATEHNDKISFAKLNTDDNLKTSKFLRILNIPTFFVFTDGKIATKWAGADPKRLKKEIANLVND